MEVKDKKIILSKEENKMFIKQFKIGVINQLYKEKLLTNEQLNEILKSINK